MERCTWSCLFKHIFERHQVKDWPVLKLPKVTLLLYFWKRLQNTPMWGFGMSTVNKVTVCHRFDCPSLNVHWAGCSNRMCLQDEQIKKKKKKRRILLEAFTKTLSSQFMRHILQNCFEFNLIQESRKHRSGLEISKSLGFHKALQNS